MLAAAFRVQKEELKERNVGMKKSPSTFNWSNKIMNKKINIHVCFNVFSLMAVMISSINGNCHDWLRTSFSPSGDIPLDKM